MLSSSLIDGSGCTMSHRRPTSSSRKKLPNTPSSFKDGDLLGVLSAQLYLAENQMQRMQSVLKKAEDRLRVKDQEIGWLKRKIREWEVKSKNQDLVHKKEIQQQKTQIENSEYLYKRCLSLEHKIFEMEKFLGDYGLVWVGDSTADASKAPDPTSNNFIMSCYAQLTANIVELNTSVGKGEVQVQRSQDGGGASFKTPSCMCLQFYKNGLVIDEGKLRPYSDPNTGSFIRDILDGYFPSELQEFYPNGVPFKVEDHRTETYLGKGFPGHGYRLGKQPFVDARPMTAAAFSTTAQSPKSSPNSDDQHRQCCHRAKTARLSGPTSARSPKQTVCPQLAPVDLLGLRSQILASHNNNCSDTHLQSHINAELGLSSRSEKKRIVATKTTECRIAINERPMCSKELRSQSACPSGRNRTTRDGSVDRSTLESSASRLGSSSSRTKQRPRSASVNDGRYPHRTSSISFFNGNSSLTPDFCNSTTRERTTKPRISKSATLDRMKEFPAIREINSPTGKLGEFRLKVRSMSGSTVFLVHVSADDTVARLYQLLDRTLSKGRTRNYKIVISGYERKRLDQLDTSLNEYGITRDSVLHLVND